MRTVTNVFFFEVEVMKGNFHLIMKKPFKRKEMQLTIAKRNYEKS